MSISEMCERYTQCTLVKKKNRLYLPLAASSARNKMLHRLFVGNATAAGIVFATFFFDIALLLPRRSVTI